MRLIIFFLLFSLAANSQEVVRANPYYRKATATSYLLDTYTGALGAYSLRKLRTGQDSCMKVRRSNDNATQTFGFVNGYLDTSGIKTFIGSADGLIEIWYDQSGNGNNITQGSANNPHIINAGVLPTTNSKATVDFGTNGNAWALNFPSGFLNGATSISYFHVAKITDYASSNAGVFGPGSTGSAGFEVLQHSVISRRTLLRINGTIRNDNSGSAYQLWDDATQSLTTIIGNSTDVKAYKNSSSVTFTSSAALPSLNFNGVYALGQYFSAAFVMYGDVQELIIYSTDQTSNRTGIETNINTFYTIYL